MTNQKLSVGEEIMQWAEKYWFIHKQYNGENYDSFRRAMVKGINDTIAERLNPEPQPLQEGSVPCNHHYKSYSDGIVRCEWCGNEYR